MPFIYPAADQLGRTPKVGKGECTDLVRFYANLPPTWMWRAGEHVVDVRNIRMGTAIATFVHGRYPQNRDTGVHAAFFLRYDAPGRGFWVMDQWRDKPGHPVRPVEARPLRPQGFKQNANGTWFAASDNADAFYVIETP